MAAAECIDCNLREFLIHWTRHNGLFWAISITIVTWCFKTFPLIQSNESEKGRKYVTDQFGASLKSRRDALISFTMYVVLLVMEFVEGYWILSYWWQCIYGYWTWNLRKSQWWLQFCQFVMVILLGLTLPVLIFLGFVLVVITLICLHELWRWEPENVEDTWQLVQGDGAEKEESEEMGGGGGR